MMTKYDNEVLAPELFAALQHRMKIISDILVERINHDEKWTTQCHHEPGHWLAVVMEEVGEIAKECLESKDNINLYNEIIQAAAALAAWAEDIDRMNEK